MSKPDPQQRTTAPDGQPDSHQPAWRREFPLEVQQDNYVARRDFTKYLGLTSLAFVVGQGWIVAENSMRRSKGQPPIKPIVTLDQIPVGGALTFAYPDENDPCLLLRPDEHTLLAYGQKCTHLSCAVVPVMDKGQLHCPCHEGTFDAATGRALSGPPRRPLSRIILDLRDGIVYATGVELRSV
ncbi:MAG: Rieske (2Fe-2S) protein [Gemmataceae bacterium]|nr:Rieske (2Fe-2S) protein [Gemmataceae bacterium]